MIVASTPLVPTPKDVTLSPSTAVAIDFAVTLSDTDQLIGASAPHNLRLKLDPANDLLFQPENAKEVERPRTLSSKPSPFTFHEKVKGAGNGLLDFDVTLVDENDDIVTSCLVGLRP